ncbi:hypothetical protein [Candidatus Poriferisodalis multihospitum]|uniref:hypothetical protein n=1 Tax=Candidatus Poriferisodalis multihospitum TaxID=2983191 RepID=UPI002B256C84|nr:hypothetical protein [Candidatus Poriferisodalis multihospitum]
MKMFHAYASPHALPGRRRGRRARAVAAAVVLAALLGSVLLATPAAAHESPANLVRHGPNLTLVLANCERSADTATAAELARHSRNAAVACVGADGVPAELTALIAEFEPDRVMVIGGPAAVPPAVMDELTAAVRSAYRWAVIQQLDGTTRTETSAAAARIVLDTPERVGPDTMVLIVADGWNDADINTAREFAAGFEDVAITYFSPGTIADGLSEATASLIADYRPARIIFAGLADEHGLAAEAAVEAVLEAIESDVSVERVALATDTPSPAVEVATLTGNARTTFEAISRGERIRPAVADEHERPPFLALTQASGIRGIGSTLFTVRADGSERILRSVDHNGWEWHDGDGRLTWADDEKQVLVAAPDGEAELAVPEGTWPWRSPDGEHLLVWNNADTNDNDRLDSFEALLFDADGTPQRSLGQMDVRTWYYGDIRDFIWSRDSTYMAYVTDHTDPETGEDVNELRIEPTDGSTPPVTLADDAVILRWSPDSRHLLYATPHECEADPTHEGWSLWIASADGSETREIGPVHYHAWSLVIVNPWSPDGKHFAYEAIDSDDCSAELRIESVDGDAEPVRIAEKVEFLGWSPDSAYLEYGEATDRPVTDYILPELSWVAHRDGSSKRFIGEVSPSVYGWIFWSEDGTYISYSEIVRDDDGNITGLVARAERADGTGEVTTLAESGNSLSWSDDDRVAYVAQHDDDGDGVPEREALYLHTPGSPDDDVELVHTLPAPTRVAIWSPDDSHLIYGSGSIESLIGWIRDRGRGVSVWGIETGQPRWMHRLITDVTWGDWQPAGDTE